MRRRRFLHVVCLIATFVLSMVLVDSVLATIPALCGQVEIHSVTALHETRTEAVPDGGVGASQTHVTITDNSSTEYGLLEQYDWMIVFGGLVLTFLISMGGAWAYAVSCRARIDECRADIDAAEQARARFLAEANRMLLQSVDHTSGTLAGAAYGVCAADDFRAVIERSPTLPDGGTLLQLLRQTERCEDRIVRGQKRRNALIAAYNDTIHSFPFLLIAGPLKAADQTSYDIARDARDVVADAMLGI